MRALFTLVLGLHGAIHLLGFARGYGLVEIQEMQTAIGRRESLLWLAAAVLLVGSAVLLWTAPRLWWIPAAAGVALSQALIFGVWSDARFGTIANVVILVPIVLAAADLRPSSLRSRYLREVGAALERTSMDAPLLTVEDLVEFPPQVRTYLERVGAVGAPRMRGFHARFRARIRGGPDEPWMEGTAEQYEVFDPPARHFFMKVRRAGLPVDVYHRYAGASASIEGRLLGIFPVLDVAGPEMTRSETVTVLNDAFFLAPAALAELPIEWEVLDVRRVRATWENAGWRVSGVAYFDAEGDLVDFDSTDRYMLNGDTPRLARWSTPIHGYVSAGGRRVPASAEARWGEAGEEWTYADFVVEEIRYLARETPER